MSDPIAYTYEAAHHCPSCTRARFGADEFGFPPENATDREGNGLGALFPWDEWYEGTGEKETLACDTCGDVLDELVPDDDAARWVVIENTPGYLPDDDDPPIFDHYSDAVRYMNERAQEYADDPDANYRVEWGIASGGNYAACMIHDDDKMHDLGRWLGVERVEPDDDDDDDEHEPEPEPEPEPDARDYARAMARRFTHRTRADGTTFTTLTDQADEWMRELVQDAHNGMLPDDWRYDVISAAVEFIADNEDWDDRLDEFANDCVDVYDSDVIAWFASHSMRRDYCEQAADDWGPTEGSIVEAMQRGQLVEAREIIELVASGLDEL